jgi:hypothetical protein
MYFSPFNGPVSANGSLIASVLPGQRIKGLSPSQSDTYVLGSCVPVQLFNLASVGAGVVPTTIEQTFVLPCRCKIPKINVSFTAIDSLSGSNLFNIVQGTEATYETAASAIAAYGSFTLTGVPAVGFTNNYVINGVIVSVAQTAVSLATQATADAAAITAATATTLVTAAAVGAVVTVTANTAGYAGNYISTSSYTNGGDVVTSNQLFLGGGSNNTGVSTAGNDNSSTSGFCTNPAVDGDALFNQDVPFIVPNFRNAHTAAVAATGYYTLSGFPTTGFNNIYGFGSLGTVTVAQTTGTLAAQATADAAAITAAAIGITATSSGPQVILTATTAGARGNFIATSASTNGGDSIFSGQMLLSGGINTGGSSGLGLIPTYYDAVYPSGAIMTLRLTTTAGTGSITNLSVSAVLIPQPLEATFPSQAIEAPSAQPYGGPYGGDESFQAPVVPVPGRDL